MALHGRVYDITELRHQHPGGRTLLDGYAGIDATSAYQRVGHDRTPEIAARLATYELGRLCTPRLAAPGQPPGVHEAWVQALYLAVEIGNALEADIMVRDSRTTASQPAGVPTPYTLQLAIDTHERFHRNVIHDLLGVTINHLRDATSQVDNEPKTRVPARLALPPSPAALLRTLNDAVALDDADALQGVDRACRAVAACDRDLLRSVIAVLRTGVQVLERSADDDVAAAEAKLLEILDGLPAMLRAYVNLVEHLLDEHLALHPG
jgi:hypothetical protein